MVMAPSSGARGVGSPVRLRPPQRLRCLLRRHDVTYVTLRATGERWVTQIHYCRRCLRVVGPTRAEKR